jgi:hypothetical protein
MYAYISPSLARSAHLRVFASPRESAFTSPASITSPSKSPSLSPSSHIPPSFEPKPADPRLKRPCSVEHLFTISNIRIYLSPSLARSTHLQQYPCAMTNHKRRANHPTKPRPQAPPPSEHLFDIYNISYHIYIHASRARPEPASPPLALLQFKSGSAHVVGAPISANRSPRDCY